VALLLYFAAVLLAKPTPVIRVRVTQSGLKWPAPWIPRCRQRPRSPSPIPATPRRWWRLTRAPTRSWLRRRTLPATPPVRCWVSTRLGARSRWWPWLRGTPWLHPWLVAPLPSWTGTASVTPAVRPSAPSLCNKLLRCLATPRSSTWRRHCLPARWPRRPSRLAV